MINFKCPHDTDIQCDSEYMLEQYYARLNKLVSGTVPQCLAPTSNTLCSCPADECPRYKKHLIRLIQCPYAQIVPLQCRADYAVAEHLRQSYSFTEFDEQYSYPSVYNAPCSVDPEVCSHYINHIIKNIQKYKQSECQK